MNFIGNLLKKRKFRSYAITRFKKNINQNEVEILSSKLNKVDIQINKLSKDMVQAQLLKIKYTFSNKRSCCT